MLACPGKSYRAAEIEPRADGQVSSESLARGIDCGQNPRGRNQRNVQEAAAEGVGLGRALAGIVLPS